MAENTIGVLISQNVILLDTLSNAAVKIGIVFWKGSKDLKKMVPEKTGTIKVF